MSDSLHIDELVERFSRAKYYAEANGHGNAAAVLARIIRDLEALRGLPREAFEPDETIDKLKDEAVNESDNGYGS